MSLEQFFKALSDQTRLRIVLLLLEQKELCVCELTQVLELSQPKISRHLAILRESGLLLGRKSGIWVHYRLSPSMPRWAKGALSNLRDGGANEPMFKSDRHRLAFAEPLGDICGS